MLFPIQFPQNSGVGKADLVGEGVAGAERLAGAHALFKRDKLFSLLRRRGIHLVGVREDKVQEEPFVP